MLYGSVYIYILLGGIIYPKKGKDNSDWTFWGKNFKQYGWLESPTFHGQNLVNVVGGFGPCDLHS